MGSISIIIPVFNKVEITKKCIHHIREFNKNYPLEIIIVDNGSTDETPDVFSNDKDIVYIRNPKNLGISKAYNSAATAAKYDVLCFMHNDVFVFKENWALKIRDFILKTSNAGIVGLYGAMLIRQNGSFMGRGIVHSKLNTGNLRSDYTKVAVVDGLLMAIRREVCNDIGRFDERYTLHYYDKDLSLKTYTAGYTNFVINIPFIHKGAETRSSLKREEDLALRNEMKKLFLEQWETRLPADVRTKSERMRDWIKKFV